MAEFITSRDSNYSKSFHSRRDWGFLHRLTANKKGWRKEKATWQSRSFEVQSSITPITTRYQYHQMKCRPIYKRIERVYKFDSRSVHPRNGGRKNKHEQKQQQHFNSIILLGISSHSIGILVWRDKNREKAGVERNVCTFRWFDRNRAERETETSAIKAEGGQSSRV